MADMDWSSIAKTLGTTIAGALGSAGALWKFLDWHKEQGKAQRDSIAEQKKLALEAAKAEDDADKKLIAVLMEERKGYQEDIKALRSESMAERKRCDEEMEKLRGYFTGIVAEQNGKIREVVSENGALRQEIAQLKKDLDTFR
jgi:uncharacterized protein HemX